MKISVEKLRLATFSILIITLLLTAGCATEPHIVKYIENETRQINNKEIYVINHGWHTGFIIPAKEIELQMPELTEKFSNTPYIEFGWGDEGFYQANEITSGLTVSALFWPTASVVHAVAIPKNIREYFPESEIKKLHLREDELNSLVTFIAGSLYQNKKDSLVELKSGIYGNSQFYKGVGHYYLMNTCNNWTAKGLKSAGLDLSTPDKLTAGSIVRYLSNMNQKNTQDL